MKEGAGMFLQQEQIERNIGWLLRNSSAAVCWLTRRDILGDDPQAASMKELAREVQRSDATAELFSGQAADGSWCMAGPWGRVAYKTKDRVGYSFASPKYVTTAWLLPFLGEIGFDHGDERIRRACEYLVREVAQDQYYTAWREIVLHGRAPGRYGKAVMFDAEAEQWNCCGTWALPLRALASVGMGADARLSEYWQALRMCQRRDGGWLRPDHLPASPSPHPSKWPWQRSCPQGTHEAARALSLSPEAKDQRALVRALEFQLWHLAQKDEREICTWYFHGHNMVRELLMFSAYGIAAQREPLPTILEWLLRMYDAEAGVFRSQGESCTSYAALIAAVQRSRQSVHSARVLRYEMFHLLEDDWLTFHLTRAAINWLRCA
jgi:hypothetical protein